MEESTLRWPTDKEREEMEEVCSIVRGGEVANSCVFLQYFDDLIGIKKFRKAAN